MQCQGFQRGDQGVQAFEAWLWSLDRPVPALVIFFVLAQSDKGAALGREGTMRALLFLMMLLPRLLLLLLLLKSVTSLPFPTCPTTAVGQLQN
mmetsp:Transcript_6822/g.18849  ORF Transcript_6822/g.18849 Transcript_6822/m.18849 type:complete len:93 (+) Transcript_6822:901-1179(+)